MLLAISFNSCKNDGGSSDIGVMEGAVPNIEKSADTDQIVNLNAISSGEEVRLGFDLDIVQGDVASADIVAFYSTSDSLYGPATLNSDVTAFPFNLTLNLDDIVSAFDEIATASDIRIGDELIVTAKLYLADGTVLNILNDDGSRNYGSDILTSGQYTVQISYPVACASDLGGNYQVVSSGSSTDSGPTADENPIADYPYNVVITDDGGGNYTISDAYGGLYILWYDIYGITGDNPGSFTDICGELSGSFPEPFGGTVTLTGTANPDGTLSITWINDFGDTADAVYTPE